ncbi:hypothetical protein BX666DRAFT_1381308 [Dichotomocladium elegans]|nr:hypothetical protein BX666DRAFT_1381308 [Dichotomocladium elegans]
MEGDRNYSAVPPPPALTGGSGTNAKPLDFNDALSKARAIAEKLKQQRATGVPAAPPIALPSAGAKRGYRDDEYADDGYGYSSREDRDLKRGGYLPRCKMTHPSHFSTLWPNSGTLFCCCCCNFFPSNYRVHMH